MSINALTTSSLSGKMKESRIHFPWLFLGLKGFRRASVPLKGQKYQERQRRGQGDICGKEGTHDRR